MFYLAGPMDFVVDDMEVERMYRDVGQAIEASQLTWYRPQHPFVNGMTDPKSVVAVNNYALWKAKGVLALLPPGVPTIGTPMEIQQALSQGKPVAVLGAQLSCQLQGSPGLKCFAMDDAIQAVRWLLQNADLYQAETESLLRWKGDPGCEPKRSYEGDAGFDLFVAEDVDIHVDGFRDVSLGISVELPPGTWAMLTGRSSTLRRRGILVTQGVIDNGYRGEIFAGCRNLSESKVHLKRGERVAQLIPFALESCSMVPTQVAELNPSDRGSNGFGSTGS